MDLAQAKEPPQSEYMPHGILNNYNMQQLKILYAESQVDVERAKKRLRAIEAEIEKRCAEQLEKLREAKKKGVVHLKVDGVDITSSRTERVTWDSGFLMNVARQLASEGQSPEAIMDVKITIPEKVWATMTEEARKPFLAARTAKFSDETIKFSDE